MGSHGFFFLGDYEANSVQVRHRIAESFVTFARMRHPSSSGASGCGVENSTDVTLRSDRLR